MGNKPSKFDQLFNSLQGYGNVHVVMIGLQNAGKSSILKSMDFRRTIKTEVMIGMSIETVKAGRDARVDVWDIKGSVNIRSMWDHFFNVAKGIVFVVDSADKEALTESARELNTILHNKKLAGIPLVVMANKQDIQGALDISKISSILCLHQQDRMWDIIGTVGTRGDGVYDAFEGLTTMMRISKSGIK